MTVISASGCDDVLARLAFVTRAGGHDADPGAVIGFDDIGLVAIPFAGDVPPVLDVSAIRD